MGTSGGERSVASRIRSAGAGGPGLLPVRDVRWLHVAGARQHFLGDEDVDALWFPKLESDQAAL